MKNNGKSTLLLPMLPRFDSQAWLCMWVEFVIGSVLASCWFSPLLINEHFKIWIQSEVLDWQVCQSRDCATLFKLGWKKKVLIIPADKTDLQGIVNSRNSRKFVLGDIWDHLGNFLELQMVDSYLGKHGLTHASYPNDPRNQIVQH